MNPQRALQTIAMRLGRTLADVTEFYEERAAIREFCGGQTRESSERAALHDTSNMEPKK